MTARESGIGNRESSSVQMSGIQKSFGAVQANRAASLEVNAGEIHALVGENGAGKSTLMRILAGLYAPDAGKIEVGGKDVTGWNTAQAIQSGVGMVHQHFMLVPTLTIAENVILGREPRSAGGLAIDLARAAKEVEEIGDKFGFRVDSRRLVRDLSVGEAQRVEILKTLFRGARILILDEPTAVLSPPEVQDLWRVLRRLRDGGGTIVLITHKLDEVLEVSDRITVMRNGETVARMATQGITASEIARAMVGRDVSLMGAAPVPTAASASTDPGASALTVRDLTVAGPNKPSAVNSISFTVAPGEILGIAGVEGNGQTELIEAIAGLRMSTSGSVLLGARDITTLNVRERNDAGLAHIPEDRHRRGLVLDYSVSDNLILGAQHRFTRGGGPQLDRSRIADNASARVRQYDIRPPNWALPARALSGGNQQKVVIAREMGSPYSVLLASQPTRGVDVGAIEFIHSELLAARSAGKAILLVSAELAEIMALSDRVAVMYGGRIVRVLPRSEVSVAVLGPLMTGAEGVGATAA